MPQLNINISDAKKEKLDWLSEVIDDSVAAVVRQAIDNLYDEQKAIYQNNQNFVRWVRANKSV